MQDFLVSEHLLTSEGILTFHLAPVSLSPRAGSQLFLNGHFDKSKTAHRQKLSGAKIQLITL